MFRKHLFLIIPLLAVLPMTAQENTPATPETWTVSNCIDYALEHNISVRQSALNVLQRENELSSAKARRLPGVSAGGSQNFSFGRGLTADNTYSNTNTTNTSFSLGADVPIFQGFTIKNNIAMSRLNLEAATVDLEKARDDIRVAVAQAYVQILYSMEIRDVARQQVAVDSMQVVRLEAMQRNGKASSTEVSAQEATLAQSRLSLTQAEGNLSLAILDLTQLLELPSPDGFSVVRPEVNVEQEALLATPDVIWEEASQTRPVMRAERLRLDYADKNIDLAKGGYLPSVSLSGGLGSNFYTASGRNSAPFGTQLKNNFSQYVGLSLSIPVFDRFSTRNNIRSARVARQNQELQLENTSKNLYKEIQQAYYNALTARSKYEGSIAAENSAREAFNLMGAKYENAKATITEYNESKTRLIKASSDLAQARWQYLYQARLLDFYRGREIVF